MQLDNEFIKRMIYRSYEGRNIEYKSSRPWKEDIRERLIKQILAMANAGGGFLIIGYDERKGSDFIACRTGISEDEFKTWDVTNVNNDINNYCAPPIGIEVIKYQDKEEDKNYIILGIPSHERTPYICTKNKLNVKQDIILKKGALYYRTKKASCEEISEPDQYDELLQRCFLSRREDLIKAFEQILRGIQEKEPTSDLIDSIALMDTLKEHAEQNNPYRDKADFAYFEIIAFPHIGQLDIKPDIARKSLKQASFSYRGWPFIFYFIDVPELLPQHSNTKIYSVVAHPFYKNEFYYWAFYYNRGIFYSRNMTRESCQNRPKDFFIWDNAKLIGEAILSLGRLYSGLEIPLDTKIEVNIRYSPANGMRAMRSDTAIRAFSSGFDDSHLTTKLTKSIIDFMNNPHKLAGETIIAIISKMGCSDGFNQMQFESAVEKYLSGPIRD
jgi:hypothetical protein